MDPVSVRGVNQDPVFRYYRTGMDSRGHLRFCLLQDHHHVDEIVRNYAAKMSYVVQGKLHIAKKIFVPDTRTLLSACIRLSSLCVRSASQPPVFLRACSALHHISSRAQPQWQSGVRNPAANIVHVLVATSLTPTTNIILATICSRRRAQAARIP